MTLPEAPMTLLYTLRAPNSDFYALEVVREVFSIVSRLSTNLLVADGGKISIFGTDSSMAKTRADYARLALLKQGATEYRD